MKKFIAFLLVFGLLSGLGDLAAQDELSVKRNFSLATQSEVAFPSLAEVYLKQLAVKTESRRKKGGLVLLIGGTVCTFAGIMALSEEEEDWFDFFNKAYGTALVIMGGVSVGGGIMYLALPSGAERKYEEVQSIQDMELRERMCRSALSSLAKKGRTRRIVYGIISSAFAAYALQQHSDYYGAVIFGALALREFIRKTPAEKAYRDYLQMSERRKELALSVGFGTGPHGGVRVGLSLTY